MSRRKESMIRTKPTAAQARARAAKDLLLRDHRRGDHATDPRISCPSCHSEGAFR